MKPEIDVYPAAVQVNGQSGQRTFRRVRVLAVNGGKAVALTWERGGPKAVLELADVAVDRTHAGHVQISAEGADTWRVMTAGDCGCGDALKAMNPEGWV